MKMEEEHTFGFYAFGAVQAAPKEKVIWLMICKLAEREDFIAGIDQHYLFPANKRCNPLKLK